MFMRNTMDRLVNLASYGGHIRLGNHDSWSFPFLISLVKIISLLLCITNIAIIHIWYTQLQ